MATKTKKVQIPGSAQGLDTRNNFSLVTKFLGYRSREDITMLAPGYMIEGSQNCLIDITGRLKSRKGYTLDGQANTSAFGVTSAFDWVEHKNNIINMRGYDTNYQFRYVNALGTVAWTTIISTLTSGNVVRATNYWDNTEKINVLLFVAADTNVYEWNGATATFLSATVNTITLQGTQTWAQLGFYTAGNKIITLGGVDYTYTGGEGTTTLTGVTPDPRFLHAAGDLIVQKVVTTANSSITSMFSTFRNDLIGNVQNQIYYGSLISNDVYISKVNNYKSVAFTSPVRLVGEGALISLRAPVVAFAPQENAMYITAGQSQWYQTQSQLSADLTGESFTVAPLKTSADQAALTQEAITHDRNSVVFLSNETRMVTLGRVDNIFLTPQMEDYSFPVAKDFNNFNFGMAAMKYWKSYLLMAIPIESKWMILNQTDPKNVFWEAPQTGAFGAFSIIDGDLYAHDAGVPQTYKLFDGYNDNGNPILSRATFAYNDSGIRDQTKYFNEFWTEGYITANTIMSQKQVFDLDGCSQTFTQKIKGNDTQVVCIVSGDASLGKTGLGKHGLGTNSLSTVSDPPPPYFAVIKTMTRRDYFRYSPTFESYGVDYHWELLSFGALVTQTMYGNNSIKQ